MVHKDDRQKAQENKNAEP